MTAETPEVGDARPAYVYLLRCRGGSLYCGWTYDVEQRVEAHRSGKGARYTRQRLPVTLEAVIELPDESSARREEARIKRLTRPQKLALARAHAPAPAPLVGSRRQRAAQSSQSASS